MRLREWLVCGMAMLGAAAPAVAQKSGPSYPNVDKPMVLGAGDTVQLLSRYVHEVGPLAVPPGRRLDFVYSTAIPASDKRARAAQADRAALALGPQAVELGVHRISMGICDTPECAARKHPPTDWFLYERTSTGWKRVR